MQVVRRARMGVVQAASALASLRPDVLAHRRLRAEGILQSAVAVEKALYTPNSATFFARHDRILQQIVVRPISGDPAQAEAARAAAVASRLLRDISYYSQQLKRLERRADRPIWQGIADAAAGGGRDAIVAAMRRPTQHDDTHGGIQGLYRDDKQFVERAGVRAPGEWITEPRPPPASRTLRRRSRSGSPLAAMTAVAEAAFRRATS